MMARRHCDLTDALAARLRQLAQPVPVVCPA
jgi:hypothetical protein